MRLVPDSPLPRNWEHAFGYGGNARWLAAYWTPCGDEAMFSDGQISATANWPAFQELVRLYCAAITNALVQSGACPADDAWAAIYYFGSSDAEASHCLLLDLAERKIYFDEIGTGYVASQHPRPPAAEVPRFTSEEVSKLISEAFARLPTARAGNFRVCGCNGGWARGEDGGYDPCPNKCDGGILWE